MTLSSRRAEARDLALLLDHMEAFNRFEQIAWTRAGGTPALERLMGDASLGHVGVLSEGDRTVGYFVLAWGYDLEWNGRDAFLTELFLAEDARGRGLGAAAMALVETAARAGGAHALHLMVRHDNERAMKVYERAGFKSPPRHFLSKRI
jgi:ribosomal protein S18 acetylase RimI-like enzyme